MDQEQQRWMKTVVAQFEARLLRYTRRLVGPGAAEEIVQETFLRLWEQDRRKLEDHLAQWLFTVCRNQAADRSRAQGKFTSEAGFVMIDTTPGPEQQAMRKQEAGSLSALVAALPPVKQEVIRLKFEEDLSYKEISAITGHSVSYVGVLIHEAVAQLRKHYE